jgi:hypothetical protein
VSIKIEHEHLPWLSREQADAAAEDLQRLLGPDATALLDIEPRPEHQHIIASVEQVLDGPGELPGLVEHAEATLRSACISGGALHPLDDRADVPWCFLLRHLGDEPQLGSAVARRWVRQLIRLQQDDQPVSPVMEGVAAYGVAKFERQLVRPWEYERWMEMAANATDHEPDRPGLSLVVVVRAVRLLAQGRGT